MIFRCQIHRQSTAFGTVSIDADDAGHARDLAEERARDGLIAWTEAGDELDVELEVEAAE